MLNGGKTRGVSVTAVSSGAGSTVVNLRPPAGKLWKVLYARGTQDDGAVTMGWNFIDPDGTVAVGAMTALGAWSNCILGAGGENANGPMPWMGAPWSTYNRYFQYHFTASAAAKNGYVYAVVEEYSGISSGA